MAEDRYTTSIDIKVDDRQIAALGEELERTFDSKLIDSFNKSIERQTKAIESLIKGQTKLAAAREAAEEKSERRRRLQPRLTQKQGAGIDRALGAAPGPRDGAGITIGGVAVGTAIGHAISGAVERAMGAAGAIAGGTGVTSKLVGATLPIAGPLLEAAAESMEQYYERFAQRKIAQANIFGTTRFTQGQFKGITGAGAAMGMTGEETLAKLPQLAQQTGLNAETGLGDVVRPLLAMQRFGGVQGAGAIVGAAGAAGGDVGGGRAEKLMFDAVGSGLIAGLRRSRLDQFIQGVGQFTEAARTKGINLDPESLLAVVRAMPSSIGLRGEAAQQFVMQGSAAVQKAGRGASLFDMMAMEAVGVTGKPGGVDVFEGLRRLENDPGAGLAGLVAGFQQGGMLGEGDPRGRALILQRQLEAQGVPLGFDAAERIVRGGSIAEEMAAGRGAGVAAGEEDLRKAKLRGAPAMKVPAIEAQFEEKRAHLEGIEKIEHAIVAMRKIDLRTAAEVLPRAAGVLQGATVFIKEVLDAAELLVGKKAGKQAKVERSEAARIRRDIDTAEQEAERIEQEEVQQATGLEQFLKPGKVVTPEEQAEMRDAPRGTLGGGIDPTGGPAAHLRNGTNLQRQALEHYEAAADGFEQQQRAADEAANMDRDGQR